MYVFYLQKCVIIVDNDFNLSPAPQSLWFYRSDNLIMKWSFYDYLIQNIYFWLSNTEMHKTSI